MPRSFEGSYHDSNAYEERIVSEARIHVYNWFSYICSKALKINKDSGRNVTPRVGPPQGQLLKFKYEYPNGSEHNVIDCVSMRHVSANPQ